VLAQLADLAPAHRLGRGRLVRQVGGEPLQLAERLGAERRLEALVQLERVEPSRLRVPLQRAHDALAVVVAHTQVEVGHG